jgi:hypothetical protein
MFYGIHVWAVHQRVSSANAILAQGMVFKMTKWHLFQKFFCQKIHFSRLVRRLKKVGTPGFQNARDIFFKQSFTIKIVKK